MIACECHAYPDHLCYTPAINDRSYEGYSRVTREESLKAFVAYCQQYIQGDEKGEAQVFLERLFIALGYPDGFKEAHGSAERRIKFIVDEKSTTKFADLVIPGLVLIEMKKRGVD